MRYCTFILALCLFFACKKKESPPAEEESTEPQISAYDRNSASFQNLNTAGGTATCNPIGYSYATGYQYFGPCVNPKNPLQFSCRRARNIFDATQKGDLVVFDFSTGKAKIIATDVLGEPDWSIKDWIIFARMETGHNSIYKIKSNGDSLTLLLSANDPEGPKWSPDGTRFVFFCNVCQVNKIADEKGSIQKSFTYRMYAPGWKSESEVLFVDIRGFVPQLASHDLKKDSLTYYNLEVKGNQTSWKFNYTSQELICCSSNLVKSSVPFNTATTLKKFTSVESQSFLDENVCPNVAGDRIISVRQTSTRLINENCMYSLRYEISIMNADGTNERKILIPE